MKRYTGRQKTYSLFYLLEKQPKTLRKSSHYRTMVWYLHSSEKLSKLRINRRCYSLLDRAVIQPKHLDNFYGTYRLPRDPFFPLFFSVKREYLNRRLRLRETRNKYIKDAVNRLPVEIKKLFEQLARYEKTLHRSGLCPVWKQFFIPRTKKRADEFTAKNTSDWLRYVGGFFRALSGTYSRNAGRNGDRIIALYLLGLSGKNHSTREIRKQYRLLSKSCHPDHGGSEESFLLIHWARDILLDTSPLRKSTR